MLGQQIANGLATGLCYAVLAAGLSLTFATSRVVNFAHGDLFVLGAFVGISLQRGTSLPFAAVAAIAIAVTALIAATVGSVVVSRVQGSVQQSVATIAGALGLRDIMLIAFGSDSASFQQIYPEGTLTFGSMAVPRATLWIGGLLAVVVMLFTFLMHRSRWGVWMRGAASNQRLASAMGISTGQMRTLAFATAGGLAGMAALVVGPVWQVSSGLGSAIGVKAFAAAIIGGFGSLRGAILGGLALGLCESLFAAYVSSAWRDLGVFSLLILLVNVAPRGIVQTAQRRIA